MPSVDDRLIVTHDRDPDWKGNEMIRIKNSGPVNWGKQYRLVGKLTYSTCIDYCHCIMRDIANVSLYDLYRVDAWLDKEQREHNAGPPRISMYDLFAQLRDRGNVAPEDWQTQSPRYPHYYELLHLLNIIVTFDYILSDRFMARQIPNAIPMLMEEYNGYRTGSLTSGC